MNLIQKATLAVGLGVGLAVISTATASADTQDSLQGLQGLGAPGGSPCHCDDTGTTVDLSQVGQINVEDVSVAASQQLQNTADATGDALVDGTVGAQGAVNAAADSYVFLATDAAENAAVAADIAAAGAVAAAQDLAFAANTNLGSGTQGDLGLDSGGSTDAG